MAQRRVQFELASIAAQQRALPAQQALQDTERAIERARLVLGYPWHVDRGTAGCARRRSAKLERNVLPGQRLAAFDAETGVIGAQRAGTGIRPVARLTPDRHRSGDGLVRKHSSLRPRLESTPSKWCSARSCSKPSRTVFSNARRQQITLQVLGA